MPRVPKVSGFSYFFSKKVIANPIEYLSQLHKKYGDIFRKKFLGYKHYFLCHPQQAEHVLSINQENYRSDPILNHFQPLLTGTQATQQFHDHEIASNAFDPAVFFEKYTTIITTQTTAMLNRWQQHIKNEKTAIPISSELDNLILSIINSTLFYKTSLEAELLDKEIPVLFKLAMEKSIAFWPFSRKNRQYKKRLVTLQNACKHEVTQRIQNGKEYDDLLGIFLHSYQVKDEKSQHFNSIVNKYLNFNTTGFITTTATLRWLFIILAQHPKIAHGMSSEIFEICHGKIPKYTDYNYLKYTRAVINEVLRLYPPVLFILRQAISKDNIMEYSVPAGSCISINPFLIHRHPHYWKDPNEFNPQRFLTKPYGQDYPYAYLPFGAGMQGCLGKNFALLEICYIAAMIMQRFKISLPDDFKAQTHNLAFLFRQPVLETLLISKLN